MNDRTQLKRPAHTGDTQSSRSIFMPVTPVASQPTQTPVHTFSQISIQPKLTVSQPDDPYEREADRVADEVMRMQIPEASEAPVTPFLGEKIARKCSMCEEAEKIEMKLRTSSQPASDEEVQAKLTDTIQREEVEDEEDEEVQAKLADTIQREEIEENEEDEEDLIQTKSTLQRSSEDSLQVDSSTLDGQLRSSKGRGNPLSDDVRSFMEPRFGVDFSQVRVHTGHESVQMNRHLNAQAFAHGQNIYFGAGKSPAKDALTAHELTHVVQQTEQIQPSKISKKPLAPLENGIIQRLGQSLKVKPTVAPDFGTTKDGKQRQYSVEQYIEMWEAEQGRTLTDAEKKTLSRGCIGITALDLEGNINPPLDDCYGTFNQAKVMMDKSNEALALQRDVALNLGLTELYNFYNTQRAVLFAKLFWSNQNPDKKKRKSKDKKAFRPDKKTGKVDMSKYKYLERPGFVNFDYGFWDEASPSFWHANHSDPGMKVYQSTKEKFAAGYDDFDRTVYCVAISKNYDPAKAVKSP
jgi:Domain of unknown function (DUF4157)/Microbial transglutaminase